MPTSTLPKLCECGCGQPTPIARQTDSRHGYVRGVPMRFVRGHSGVPLADRFWQKVDKTPGHGPWGDCWVWTAARSRWGYGNVAVDGCSRRAHRVVYELTRGPIPPGMLACHRCDNPPCVNPDHLFLGSHDDNAKDCVSKGRSPHGDRNASAKLTPESVREIRRRYAAGASSQRALADEFGVEPSVVSVLVRRKTWKDVS